MPTPTYIPLATETLAGTDSSITFSSIPATYRDLVFVYNGQLTGNGSVSIRLNTDTGSNYSHVLMNGPVSSVAFTANEAYVCGYNATASLRQVSNFTVMDYSATDKHKTILSRSGYTRTVDSLVTTEASAMRWANTAAVHTLEIRVSSAFAIGSTFSLYGVN